MEMARRAAQKGSQQKRLQKQWRERVGGNGMGRTKTAATKTQNAKRRLRPGRVALRDIRKAQRSTELCIPKHPFMRLCREIACPSGAQDIRFQASAIEALQESTEAFLVRQFELYQLLAIHAKRVTVMDSDMKMLQQMRVKDGQA